MWQQSIITVRIFVFCILGYLCSFGLLNNPTCTPFCRVWSLLLLNRYTNFHILSPVISSSASPVVSRSLGMWRDVPSCLVKCVDICNTLKNYLPWNGSGINYNLNGQFEQGDSFLLIQCTLLQMLVIKFNRKSNVFCEKCTGDKYFWHLLNLDMSNFFYKHSWQQYIHKGSVCNNDGQKLHKHTFVHRFILKNPVLVWILCNL
jgi:hypothetical protein